MKADESLANIDTRILCDQFRDPSGLRFESLQEFASLGAGPGLLNGVMRYKLIKHRGR